MSAVLKSVPKRDRRYVSVSHSTYIDVDVDVPMEEISTEDLLDELAERDTKQAAPHGLTGIYELMALGKREEAYEAMRIYIMDATGRILP